MTKACSYPTVFLCPFEGESFITPRQHVCPLLLSPQSLGYSSLSWAHSDNQLPHSSVQEVDWSLKQ